MAPSQAATVPASTILWDPWRAGHPPNSLPLVTAGLAPGNLHAVEDAADKDPCFSLHIKLFPLFLHLIQHTGG